MENTERIEFAEIFKTRTKKFVVDNIELLPSPQGLSTEDPAHANAFTL